jgi:hypothetical protein
MAMLDEFLAWLSGLPAGFAFLLALPFVVAFVGLLQDACERRGRRRR